MEDQAASLRRLTLTASAPVSFAFLGARGTGTSALAAECAMALAVWQSRRVLLIDGHASQNLARRMLHPTRDTLDTVLSEQLALDAAVGTIAGQLPLLGLYARPIQLEQLSSALFQRLNNEFTALTRDLEFLLLDTPSEIDDCALAAVADNLVLVLTPDDDALTHTYSTIKRLAQHFGRRKFNVLINRAQNLDNARHIFQRLARVSSEYLTVSLRWVGFVPEDYWLKRATVMKTTATQAFNQCEAAIACRQLANALPLWNDEPGAAHSLFERLVETTRHLREISAV